MKKLLLFAIVILGFSAVSFAQLGASGYSLNGTSSATIITPISLEDASGGQGLRFGTIARGTDEGTVKIASDGTRSKLTGNLTLSAISVGGAASFKVKGETGAGYVLTLPSANQKVANGSDEMVVSNFTSSLGVTNAGVITGGEVTISVGATLTVKADQAAKAYTGTFPVIVNYN